MNILLEILWIVLLVVSLLILLMLLALHLDRSGVLVVLSWSTILDTSAAHACTYPMPRMNAHSGTPYSAPFPRSLL